MLTKLFTIRGNLDKKTTLFIEIGGIAFLILLWHIISTSGMISKSLLPSPGMVIGSLGQLHFDDSLVRNLAYSIKLSLLGYVEAILICIPIGFVIGLFPVLKGLFNKPIDALRFLPLTALTGVFIAWFGIDDTMKIQFLAFGIIVYLLPTVVQRIHEVEEVYQQTIFTLGATKWQTIRHVFIPAVMSKISDDIRVLVAISWTYIIVAEMLNKTGGVGAMLATAARQSRIDKVFCILFIIVLIGFIQDVIFAKIDKMIFPHKHS